MVKEIMGSLVHESIPRAGLLAIADLGTGTGLVHQICPFACADITEYIIKSFTEFGSERLKNISKLLVVIQCKLENTMALTFQTLNSPRMPVLAFNSIHTTSCCHFNLNI